MDRESTGIFVLDVESCVTLFKRDVVGFLRMGDSVEEHMALNRKLCDITRDIVDDIVTENLYWTTHATVCESERYLTEFSIKEGMESEVSDLIEFHIVHIETLLDGLKILPSWSFFDIEIKSFFIVIHRYGDYRIEDWMKKNKNKRIKKTRLSR